jgi:hypothetical protein
VCQRHLAGAEPVRAAADEVCDVDGVTVLSHGATVPSTAENLDYAVLRLDGAEFEAFGDGKTTLINTRHGD